MHLRVAESRNTKNNSNYYSWSGCCCCCYQDSFEQLLKPLRIVPCSAHACADMHPLMTSTRVDMMCVASPSTAPMLGGSAPASAPFHDFCQGPGRREAGLRNLSFQV